MAQMQKATALPSAKRKAATRIMLLLKHGPYRADALTQRGSVLLPGTHLITGIHALLYTKDAKRVRTFFRDVLGFPHVDAGRGYPTSGKGGPLTSIRLPGGGTLARVHRKRN